MPDTVTKHKEKIEEAKADIAEFLGKRLTRLKHETGLYVCNLSMYTAVVRAGVGQHVKDIAVIEVSFQLENGNRA